MTTPIDRNRAMSEALSIAFDAASIIKTVYAQPFDVEYKGPNDPVTRADTLANERILERLVKIFPGVPIVAEESDAKAYAGFENERVAWFVDPLDGTREFVEKNGEFAVMIGLAEEGRATVGAVVWPALDRAFVGAIGIGAFEVDARGERHAMHVTKVAALKDAELLVSRGHRTEAADVAFEKLGVRKITKYGSAGVKALKVACGESDLYAQLGFAGARWDTCAPEAIVRAAGGELTDASGVAIDYRSADVKNRNGFLATNGALHEALVRKLAAT